VDIPAHWKQGRTAYGGISTALAYEAVCRTYDDLPPLRSANINFVGPVSSDPFYKTQILRQGRNVTSVESKAFIEGAVVLSTNFAFGRGRESDLNVDFSAPKAPPPSECEPFTPEFARDFVPQFFHNFDTRLIAGQRPTTGADKGYIRTWSRHFDESSQRGVASLLCLADVLPPAAMPMFTRMGPVSSMTWIFNLLSDDPQTEDGWWQIESELTAAREGYSTQVMRIWNSQGELVVEGMQSVTLFI
jgi:acyl-CoA thioesterase